MLLQTSHYDGQISKETDSLQGNYVTRETMPCRAGNDPTISANVSVIVADVQLLALLLQYMLLPFSPDPDELIGPQLRHDITIEQSL